MIVGASKFSDFNLEKIKDFNTINCYYFKKFFSKKYNIINCSLQELLINMYYLDFDIECSIVTNLGGLIKKHWTNELLNYFLNKVKKVLISTDSVNDQYIMDNTTFNKYCFFIAYINYK